MSTEVREKEGPEKLDSEDQAVSQLLGKLGRVDAPPDFEQGVMTRIKTDRPVTKGIFAFPIALRYAIPLLLVLVVGSVVVYKSFRADETPKIQTGAVVEPDQNQPDQVLTEQNSGPSLVAQG